MIDPLRYSLGGVPRGPRAERPFRDAERRSSLTRTKREALEKTKRRLLTLGDGSRRLRVEDGMSICHSRPRMNSVRSGKRRDSEKGEQWEILGKRS